MREADFSAGVIKKLAERAGYICSNPGCNRITVGPSNADPTKSAKTGIAAHICSAQPNGPRYDMSQTPAQRRSIENGIWLCGACALLIDKNGGIDYRREHLRRWKADHETLMTTCLEGSKRVVLQFLQSPTDLAEARSVLLFLQQRGALFMPYQSEISNYVIDSIKEIRTFLTQLQASLSPESPLDPIVESINHACRHFMNTTSPQATVEELAFGLGALRKIVGINVGELERLYGIKAKSPLHDAIPH